ncbi:MAG: hypothetical protein J5857_02325 [Treponema sp.]|nr:hypothetical protein [Treponema sp.]
MKKSIKVLFTAGILGLVMALTSCASLLDAVGGAMTQAASLYDKTFTYQNVELTFRSESADGYIKLDVRVNGSTPSGYSWNLDNEDLSGERDVIIYLNGTTRLGRLTPNSLIPTTLTANGSINIGGITVPNGAVFRN